MNVFTAYVCLVVAILIFTASMVYITGENGWGWCLAFILLINMSSKRD
jgi:hypothetical protein